MLKYFTININIDKNCPLLMLLYDCLNMFLLLDTSDPKTENLNGNLALNSLTELY